jgi:GTPase SAR1 family protein
MTRRQSFDNLAHWVAFLRQQGDIPFVLIGNKEDLVDKLEVTSEEAVNYAFSVESQFFATSAKSGQNVELAFRQVQIEAVDLYKRSGPGANEPMVELDPGSQEVKGGCC